MVHERPPPVPRARILPFAPFELDFRPNHIELIVVRFGHPQVDSLQKLALLASPGVMLVFCCEPELSDGFLTDTRLFHNFSLLNSILPGL